MIKYTAVSTDQRKINIHEQVNAIQYNQSTNLAGFGIRVNDRQFLQVPARRLPAPTIEYSNGSSARPAKGVWTMDFRNKNTFLDVKPVNCLKWCVLNTDQFCKDFNVDNFISEV